MQLLLEKNFNTFFSSQSYLEKKYNNKKSCLQEQNHSESLWQQGKNLFFWPLNEASFCVLVIMISANKMMFLFMPANLPLLIRAHSINQHLVALFVPLTSTFHFRIFHSRSLFAQLIWWIVRFFHLGCIQ